MTHFLWVIKNFFHIKTTWSIRTLEETWWMSWCFFLKDLPRGIGSLSTKCIPKLLDLFAFIQLLRLPFRWYSPHNVIGKFPLISSTSLQSSEHNDDNVMEVSFLSYLSIPNVSGCRGFQYKTVIGVKRGCYLWNLNSTCVVLVGPSYVEQTSTINVIRICVITILETTSFSTLTTTKNKLECKSQTYWMDHHSFFKY